MSNQDHKQLFIGAPEYVMRPLKRPATVLVVPGTGVLLGGVAEFTRSEIKALKTYDLMTRFDDLAVTLLIVVAVQVIFTDMDISKKLSFAPLMIAAYITLSQFKQAYYKSAKRQQIDELWGRLLSLRLAISVQELDEFMFELRLMSADNFEDFEPFKEGVKMSMGCKLALLDEKFKPRIDPYIKELNEFAGGLSHPENAQRSKQALLHALYQISSEANDVLGRKPDKGEN